MRVSLNTIKQYTDADLPVDELVAKINQQLGGVEDVIDLGERYKDALIVKIVSAEQHPNADRLKVTRIDDGGVRQNVERDENGYVQVVCGAPNAREGILAVWLPPESTVPSSVDEGEPFVLGARELRGVLSQGMLAAPDELAIGRDHAGILEISPDEWKPTDVEIKPGASFAKVYGLDDTVIDIENKMFTHRPDLFGQLGVAREVAGIQHNRFSSPDWYKNVPEFKNAEGLELTTFNDTAEKVPRFMTVAIKDVEVKPSPLWLQVELVRLGSKPINNIVDVTNYIMLLTAQPTHAYDYDKLRGNALGARMARQGETAELLNGKTYQLTEDDIVIVDGEGVVGLGGIMGGGNSEVSEDTKNIVLEVANFDMYTVRKSSMRHGLFTDALTRFNKGQSPLQNPYVLNLLMMSVHDVAGGQQATAVADETAVQGENRAVDVTPEFINQRLGLALDGEHIKRLLTNVEINVDGSDTLTVAPPFWRTDLELPEDIVEEVGRLYGFDKLPRELPLRSVKPAAHNPYRSLKQSIRENLARAGANEALTYSFVHENIMIKAGQDSSHAFKLSNALSPDLQYYRLSLLPSLLDKVHMNIRAGYDEFALFEIGKVHFKGEMDADEPNVPNEDSHVALVIANDNPASNQGAAYYQAREIFGRIASIGEMDTQRLADFDLSADEWGAQLVSVYEPERSAVIVKDGQIWGVIGEFTTAVRRAFKLPDYSAGFEVHLDMLRPVSSVYHPLSKFPSSERDICFQVASAVTYDQVVRPAREALALSGLETSIVPLDIYEPADGEVKNITIRIKLTAHDRTLTGEEVAAVIDGVAAAVITETSASVI